MSYFFLFLELGGSISNIDNNRHRYSVFIKIKIGIFEEGGPIDRTVNDRF